MIGWGILGAGNIAHRFVKGLSFSKEGRLVAVASHSKEKKGRVQNVVSEHRDL